MQYSHEYHAGNFADVIKHTLLTMLILSYQKKPAPFCFIDTHAGGGHYDLLTSPDGKSKDYENGIEKVIHANNPPPAVKQYLRCVHEVNNRMLHAHYAALQYYPGSPMIARHLMRGKDRMELCEIQAKEHQQLRNYFLSDNHVTVHHGDGLLNLKRFLPPREGRGIILIDPPYEDPDEFTRLAKALPGAIERFKSGTYAIWYPISDRPAIEHFHRSLRSSVTEKILIIELTIYPEIEHHLNGSGLAVINPPWSSKDQVAQVLEWLWNALSINHQGQFSANWL